MGVRSTFSPTAVIGKIKARKARVTPKIATELEKAATELAAVTWDLAPVKTGTLEKSIKIRKRSKENTWSVYINTSQKVPRRPITVGDYIGKIESGAFGRIGRLSREKEEMVNKRRLAGLGVRRSPQGTYVGGIFFGRASAAVWPKWKKKIAKLFQQQMRRRT